MMKSLHVHTADPMPARELRLKLTVARWGNSFAVRLPAEATRALGVGEGDKLAAELSSDGRLILWREGRMLGKDEVRRLRRLLARQGETAPVTKRVRGDARF
jgi:antitoxin component of MazEF toxin-antitoxin module